MIEITKDPEVTRDAYLEVMRLIAGLMQGAKQHDADPETILVNYVRSMQRDAAATMTAMVTTMLTMSWEFADEIAAQPKENRAQFFVELIDREIR